MEMFFNFSDSYANTASNLALFKRSSSIKAGFSFRLTKGTVFFTVETPPIMKYHGTNIKYNREYTKS